MYWYRKISEEDLDLMDSSLLDTSLMRNSEQPKFVSNFRRNLLASIRSSIFYIFHTNELVVHFRHATRDGSQYRPNVSYNVSIHPTSGVEINMFLSPQEIIVLSLRGRFIIKHVRGVDRKNRDLMSTLATLVIFRFFYYHTILFR